MSKIYGVDVSSNNYSVNWNKLKTKYNVKCAMLRAGFGNGTLDTRIIENIKACKNEGIKYGLYWFSYALSSSDAIAEADYVCDIAGKYGCDIGIAYDWEYDSERYAKTQGVNITNNLRANFAISFLERVKERGYTPILYTNPDYLENKGFNSIVSKYNLWLAQWGASEPYKNCMIWQYNVSKLGELGEFDLNEFFIDIDTKDIKDRIVEYINTEQFDNYLKISLSVIGEKYGTGDECKRKIRALGYDYEMVQEMVNYILSSKEHLTHYFINKQYKYYIKKANEIKGKLGDKTKSELNAKGYDYEIARELSKLI